MEFNWDGVTCFLDKFWTSAKTQMLPLPTPIHFHFMCNKSLQLGSVGGLEHFWVDAKALLSLHPEAVALRGAFRSPLRHLFCLNALFCEKQKQVEGAHF